MKVMDANGNIRICEGADALSVLRHSAAHILAQYVERVPYMLVIGEQEAKTQTVSVRSRDTGKTEVMSMAAWIDRVKNEIEQRHSLA